MLLLCRHSGGWSHRTLPRQGGPQRATSRPIMIMRADMGGNCDAVSCSLTKGYVISTHDDEAAVNETVVFTPMDTVCRQMWTGASSQLGACTRCPE